MNKKNKGILHGYPNPYTVTRSGLPISSTSETLLYGWSKTTLKWENPTQKTNISDHRLHIWWTPLHRSAIMLTYGERRFINRRSCWSLHTYNDHRLRTWRSLYHRPAIMLTLYNFSNLQLHTYGERRFFDRRSCWQNAASSTGDHDDLCIPSATTDYARMEIAVSCWPLHIFDDHRLRPPGDRRFIDRRSCWPWRSPFHQRRPL